MMGADDTHARDDVVCDVMTPATRAAAMHLLGGFLAQDAHYRASAAEYGDGGPDALARAIGLFLEYPEIGFVWLASSGGDFVGACVVCYAISTSRGTLVAKLDDVTIAPHAQRHGIGARMLAALVVHLRRAGIGRIDTACHRSNCGAWRFYERMGFRALDEERIALLIPGPR